MKEDLKSEVKRIGLKDGDVLLFRHDSEMDGVEAMKQMGEVLQSLKDEGFKDIVCICTDNYNDLSILDDKALKQIGLIKIKKIEEKAKWLKEKITKDRLMDPSVWVDEKGIFADIDEAFPDAVEEV